VNASTRAIKPPTIQLALADDDSILGLSATQPQQKKEDEKPKEKEPERAKEQEKPKEKEPEKPREQEKPKLDMTTSQRAV
jgi:hypothetical protein